MRNHSNIGCLNQLVAVGRTNQCTTAAPVVSVYGTQTRKNTGNFAMEEVESEHDLVNNTWTTIERVADLMEAQELLIDIPPLAPKYQLPGYPGWCNTDAKREMFLRAWDVLMMVDQHFYNYSDHVLPREPPWSS